MKALADVISAVQHINIIRHLLPDDGTFPNNALLPLLVYRNVFHLSSGDTAKTVEEILESNGWTHAWRDGVYDYHHYHSTAHEVLCVIRGSARIQFGGPSGISLLLEQGDAVIIPAGVAHKNIGDNTDFECIGAYPDGQQYDMNYGKKVNVPAPMKTSGTYPYPKQILSTEWTGH